MGGGDTTRAGTGTRASVVDGARDGAYPLMLKATAVVDAMDVVLGWCRRKGKTGGTSCVAGVDPPLATASSTAALAIGSSLESAVNAGERGAFRKDARRPAGAGGRLELLGAMPDSDQMQVEIMSVHPMGETRRTYLH